MQGVDELQVGARGLQRRQVVGVIETEGAVAGNADANACGKPGALAARR